LKEWSAAPSPVNITGNYHSASAQRNRIPSARCPMGRQKTVLGDNFIGF
jgi:hypothetical protein